MTYNHAPIPAIEAGELTVEEYEEEQEQLTVQRELAAMRMFY